MNQAGCEERTQMTNPRHMKHTTSLPAPMRHPVRLAILLAGLAFLLPSTAAAYTVQGVGTHGHLSSAPAAINDHGLIAATLTGT